MMLPLEEQALLTTLLTQPHRKYHNINHINACLVELANFNTPVNLYISNLGVSSGEETFRLVTKVEYAIWWHDAIYNPYAKDNEDQSAELFAKFHAMNGGAFDGTERRDIYNIILATKRHTQHQPKISYATQVMLDIDLSGFGKSRLEFAKNGMNIRHEYYNTSLRTFLEGRMKFYELLKDRATLYYTKHFFDLYHEQSIVNMNWEMKVLETALESDLQLWCDEMEAATVDY